MPLFRPLALFDNEENTDIIFLVGEEPDVQRIPAHSWVLVEKSPVFRAMFKGPLATLSNQQQSTTAQQQPRQSTAATARFTRHRTSSGNSYDKYPASSLSTIPDNEDDEEEQDLLAGQPIEFEVKDKAAKTKAVNKANVNEDQSSALVGNLAEYTFIDVTDQSAYNPKVTILKNPFRTLLDLLCSFFSAT